MSRADALIDAMSADDIIVKYLKDEGMATQFYRALSNMQWERINTSPEDIRIIDKLKGTEGELVSFSWRSAAGVVAELRHLHYNTNEDYMDFYCAGNEGYVSEEVEACMNRIGWKKHPWKD